MRVSKLCYQIGDIMFFNLYQASYDYLVKQTKILFECDNESAIDIVNAYLDTPNVVDMTFENILEELASSLQTGQSLPNVINFIDRRDQLKTIFKNYSVSDLIASNENDLYNDCFNEFGRCVINGSFSWKKYIGGILDGAYILSRFSNVNQFIDEINNFANLHNGLTFEQYQDSKGTNMRASQNTRGWKIYGMKNAIASNFLKEIGFLDYVKPDTHFKAALQAINVTFTDDNDCLRKGRDIARKCRVTPYALDRVVWLCCSGHYYRHRRDKLGGGASSLKQPYLDYLKEEYQKGKSLNKGKTNLKITIIEAGGPVEAMRKTNNWLKNNDVNIVKIEHSTNMAKGFVVYSIVIVYEGND